MIPTRQDLEVFEKVCRAATQGDWFSKLMHPETKSRYLIRPKVLNQYNIRIEPPEDCQFMASASPKSCLILLGMLREVDRIVDVAIKIQAKGEVKKEDFFDILDSLVRYEQRRKPVMILDPNYKGPKPT